MFGWIVFIAGSAPFLFPLVRELVSDAVFWVWMGRNDVGVTHHKPLVASERPTRAEVEGFTGMVVEGELA